MTDATRLLGRAQSLATRIVVSKDHRRVIGSAVLVGVLTLAVKLSALGRDVIVAAELGTSAVAEASLAAWAFPGFVAMILGNAAVGSLVPLVAEARAKRGDEAAGRVYGELMTISLLVLGLATVVLAILPRVVLPILASSFAGEKLELTIRLWMLMLPALFLYGLCIVWSGMLNSGDRFGVAAAAPMAAPIVSGAALLLVPSRPGEALAVGFVLGNVVQLSLLAWELRRHRVTFRPAWFGGLQETRAALVQFAPLVANGIVFGGLTIVDQGMAATLGDRGIAILGYGSKLVLPILGITSAALATAIFPYFSRLAAAEDWRGIRRTLALYTKLILVASIPTTLVLFGLSREIVRLLFERGAFDAADTSAVAAVQATYVLMIPFYALAVMWSRVLVALQATRLMLISSVVVFVVNVVGDYFFKEWIGVRGIALASVVNFMIQLTFSVVLVRRLLRQREATCV